jgi:hypothetical protein
MKGSIIRGLVLSLSILLVSFPAISFAQYSPPSKESSQPQTESRAKSQAKRLGIDSSGTGVRIDVENQPLTDVLMEISRQTGIRFKVASSLTNQTLTTSIQAPDWKTGIETLLEEISTVTLWENNSRMSEIVLLGNNDGSEVFSSKSDSSVNSSINSQNNPGIPLTKKQLEKLAKGPFGNPLPPEFLEKSPFRDFLLNQGVETEEDLKQVNKAVRVRKAARLQLRSLNEKSTN